MAVTIDTLTIDRLRVLPVSYEESSVREGRAARQWTVLGLLRSADAVAVANAFDAWLTDRSADPDTLTSGVVGTTVAFTGAAGGQSWSAVPCWFTSAPSTSPVGGGWYQVEFTLVDAAGALAVLLLDQEAAQSTEEIDHGTYTLGGVVLTLLEQPDGYTGGPTLERTAAGGLVKVGPVSAIETKTIVGWTDEAGWDTIWAWYPTALLAAYSSGNWFPNSEPTMKREAVVIEGVKTTRCVVSITLWRIP